MLITPDRSEYKPPSAANTSGVANRMVENKSATVKIWRIALTVLCTLYFVLCSLYFYFLRRWSTERRNAFSFGDNSSTKARRFLTSDCDKSFLVYERRNQWIVSYKEPRAILTKRLLS